MLLPKNYSLLNLRQNLSNKTSFKVFLFSLVCLATLGIWQSVTAAASPSISEVSVAASANNSLSLGDGSWAWQAPTPQGNYLRTVDCPSPTICLAGGDASALLRSSDSGITWHSISLGLSDSYSFKTINCPSTTICYAVGPTLPNSGLTYPSLVFKTTDGGINWTGIDVTFGAGDLALYFRYINCPTVTTCYATGAGDNNSAVYKSIDGGVSWSQQYSSSYGINGGDRDGLKAISCASESNCVMLGNDSGLTTRVAVTIDGGAIWTPHTLVNVGFGSMKEIDCPSVLRCYAVGEYGVISISIDGGDNWSRQESGTFGGLNSISCPSDTTCTIVGDSTDLHTVNSGTTWTRQNPTGLISEDAVSCPTINTCVAVGSSGKIVTTQDGGNNWTLQTGGLRSASAFPSISCPSAAVCYMAGYVGRVLKTSDSGTTWTGLTTGIYNTLSGISCPSLTVCYVAGDAGTILKTVDGGTTWAILNAATTQPLLAISCPTVNVCYSAGGIELNGPGDAVITFTTNGGTTWNLSAIPATYRLYAISCFSASACVAGGETGVLLHTSNSGVNWSSVTPKPGSILSLSCPTATTCYAGTIENTDPHAILVSSDGGVSWNPTYNNFYSTFVYGMSCLPGTNTCYALANSNGLLIIITTNGFTNTTDQRPNIIPYSLSAISCPTATTCYASGGARTVISSVDSGVNWSIKSAFSNNLNSVACSSNSNCVTVGDSGNILNTNNGGASWVAQVSGTYNTLKGVSCSNTNICFAVGNFGTLLISTNGGVNWSPLDSKTTQRLYAIACPSASNCIAVGYQGAVSYTTNGGGTWSSQTSGISGVLSGISCPSAVSCYAINTGGSVFHSINGGVSWTFLSLAPGVGNFNGISCPTTAICLAVDDAGEILKTINSAGNWSQVYNDTYTNFVGINCPDSSFCAAITVPAYNSSVGSVFLTTNGGNTGTDWSSPTLGYTGGLQNIFCRTATSCLAVGKGGVTLAQSFVVNSNAAGIAPGTLGYALTTALPGQVINLKLAAGTVITPGVSLPPAKVGVSLNGPCLTGPGITINGTGVNGNGLILQGGNYLYGLRIINFGGQQVKLNGTGNKFSCVLLAKQAIP